MSRESILKHQETREHSDVTWANVLGSGIFHTVGRLPPIRILFFLLLFFTCSYFCCFVRMRGSWFWDHVCHLSLDCTSWSFLTPSCFAPSAKQTLLVDLFAIKVVIGGIQINHSFTLTLHNGQWSMHCFIYQSHQTVNNIKIYYKNPLVQCPGVHNLHNRSCNPFQKGNWWCIFYWYWWPYN